MTDKTPGQAAYAGDPADAFYAWYDENYEPDHSSTPPDLDVPREAFCAGWEQAREHARDQLATATAELERARQACQTLGTAVTGQGRAMQAAWIDLVRGDPAAAQETLAVETENVPELHTWNGTETGAEWLRRTEAEGS